MLIEYKNVDVVQEGTLVLKNVDFHVEEGELIYIIGKVGTGKSSLLKTIYCEIDINKDAEQCVVLGEDYHKLKRRHVPKLRKQMGLVFQDFRLLEDRSIGNNLRFVLKATGWKKRDEIEARVVEALRQVGMEDAVNKMPYMLSGGEQQRVAIARALLNSPKIILADEPTGHLDPESEEGILELFQEISKSGTAVVVSTHRYALLDKYPGTIYKCGDQHLTAMTLNEIKSEPAEPRVKPAKPGEEEPVAVAPESADLEEENTTAAEPLQEQEAPQAVEHEEEHHSHSHSKKKHKNRR